MGDWRISRRFIERILTEYTAGEAIARVNGYLAARDPGDPELGFTRPEMNLRMFCIYTGEVGNGGHCQFFLNPGGSYAERVLVALNEMSLTRLEDILRRAVEVFPEGRVPQDGDERERAIERLTADSLKNWGRLDRELYEQASYDDQVLAYLRRNRVLLLQPESG